MVQELFYELRGNQVLIYRLDGLTSGHAQYLNYFTQMSLPTERGDSLDSVLQEAIAAGMRCIPRRVKQPDQPTFDFTATPFSRDKQEAELPTVSGQYANPHYQAAGSERRI